MQNLQDTSESLISRLHQNTKLKIVITTHHKPDGDAMGSSLALNIYLKIIGHHVSVITPTDYPRFLHWMPGHEDVIVYEGHENKCLILTHEADFIFCLDFNNLNRINEYGTVVRTAKGRKVMIDHHLEPEGFDDYRFWTNEASSTCELIYEFIKKAGDTELITKELADCLYTGMMTDTGSFRYRGTSAGTHRIIAELIDKGAQNSLIHELVYDTNSLLRLKMMGYVLFQKIEVLEDFNTALLYLNNEELARYNIKTGDTEGFVNLGLSIEGIKFSVLIIDRTKLVKMSFRSKGDFSCNDFARKYFEGGGHKNAAGGQSTLSLEETVQKFMTVLQDYREELNQV